MNRFVKLFDPTFIGYSYSSIYSLCQHYTDTNTWDDVYPGIKLDSKRYSEDFLDYDTSKIIDSFNPKLGITYRNAQIFRMKPNDYALMHKDTDRSSAILFPITPIGANFAPIRFYDDDKELMVTLNYSKQAILLNVLEWHDIANNEFERINFQIDFQIPFDELCELHQTGNLFR